MAKETRIDFTDFRNAEKEEWAQLRMDFVKVYKKEPRNVSYYEVREEGGLPNGYYTWEVGDLDFPSYFRGSTNGRVSYVDPYTFEGFAIVNGKVESNKVTNWYQKD